MYRKRIVGKVRRIRYFLGKSLFFLLAIVALVLSIKLYSFAEENKEDITGGELQLYEVEYEKPNGNHEYYRIKPEIRMIHKDSNCITKYEFTAADGRILKGTLEKAGQEGVILSAQMKEGNNYLKVWMEILKEEEFDKLENHEREQASKDSKISNDPEESNSKDENDSNWEVLSETIQNFEFQVDTVEPEITSITYQQDEGLEIIYCNSTLEIVATGIDSGSGVDGIEYMLCDGEKQYAQGETCKVQIPNGYEGNVTFWSLDLSGNKSKEAVTKYIVCDTNKPSIQMTAPKGFDTWYQQDFQVSVNVKEESLSSGLARAAAYLNGELVWKKTFQRADTRPTTEVEFSIPISQESQNGSPVSIQVEAVDKSGNAFSLEQNIYLDKTAPLIEVAGVENEMITSKDCIVKASASDNNLMNDFKVQATAENTDGTSMEVPVNKVEENEYLYEIMAQKDGVYHLKIQGTDLSGNYSENELQFIIDKQNPVIRYVEQLNGTYVQHFRWLYEPDEMIRDFSSYEYHMELDGKLFATNQMVEQEGRHMLLVTAKDAAGNTSNSEAVFYVDHTAPVIITEGVENGKSYPANAELVISLEKESDFVTAISINGESQKINQNSQVFQFPFEAGEYEVKIYAEDCAGNAAIKQMAFQVKEENSLVASIMKPMKEMLGITKHESEKTKRRESSMKSQKLWMRWILGIAGISIACGGFFFVMLMWKKKEAENKKTP